MKTKFFLILLCFSATSIAQVKYNQHFGKVLPIITGFPETGFSTVSEIQFSKRVNGSRSWHKSYGYPVIGCSFSFSQFGNWDVMGGGLTVMPTIAHIKDLKKGWAINSKGGLGVAFFNNPFNAISNPDNIMIGSPVTAAANGTFTLTKQIGKVNLGAGLCIWHWSNGHTNVPNVGGNFIGYQFGIRYDRMEQKTEKSYQFALDSVDRKLHFDVAVSFGIQEVEGTVKPADGTRYPVYSTTMAVTKRMGFVHKLSLGVDLNYFTSYHSYMVDQELLNEKYRLNSFNVVGFIGDEFLFGRMSLVAQVGLNIWNPYRIALAKKQDDTEDSRSVLDIYSANKIGFRYYWSKNYEQLNKKLYSEIGLKTIFGKADFVYLKLGFNI